MNKKTLGLLLGLSATLTTTSAVAEIYQNAGMAEQQTRYATKHKVVNNAKQHRNQQGWMYVDKAEVYGASGFYQAGNWLKLHNRNMEIGIGSISMAFNPSKLDCTQGFSFELEVGDDTVGTIKPNCDDLLNASVTYPVSHTFDLFEAPAVAVPMDPLGLFQIGVKFGVGVEVGADFTVGGVIGGHGNEQPYVVDGVRRPDYIYASVEPYVAGKVSASAYGSIGHGVSEFGVKGKMNLLKVKGKGYMEAGVRRVEVDDQVKEQGFLELKISGKVSGGDGKVLAYCKKLWGLLYFSADIVKWGPLYEYERTFFEYASPVWEDL